MIKWVAISLACSLAVMLAGCGGGSDIHGTARTKAATTAGSGDFDPNKLSAIVLGPQDVPTGLGGNAAFNPSGGDGTSFTTYYGGNDFYIQSTVGRFNDSASRDDSFQHIRRGIAALAGGEKNYNLQMSDRAYSYESADPPQVVTLAFRNDYFAIVVLRSENKTHAAEATDRAMLDRLTNLVWDRIDKLIRDPESITPVADAPKFNAPAGTPAPATTP